MPAVSVVCAWYNRADYLRLTLDSLLAQSFPEMEIVLVNDGSPDLRVRQILESYDDPRLTVIHQENAGFTRAIRRAIDASRGRFLAIQGAGDISFPSRMTRQAAFLDAHPDFVAVGCKINNVLVGKGAPPPGLPADQPGFDGSAPEAGRLRQEATAAQIVDRNPFTHGEVMIRRSAYDAVGGYRTFFANAQDADLWLRLIEKGRLGVLEDWLYQRHTFASDGIATSLRKMMVQLSYYRMADQCHAERARGRADSVDLYGGAAMLRLRRTPSLLTKVLRRVRQAHYYRNLDMADLRVVRDLYGPLFWAAAWMTAAGLFVLRRR